MADNKQGRDKQAHDVDKRQRKRDLVEELERGDETEPPVSPSKLGPLENELGSLEFPVTAARVVEEVGNSTVEAPDGSYTVSELVPETEAVAYESPTEVRQRVQRPTIAIAMKRVTEATGIVSNVELDRSQREAYEKTFRALKGTDADDDDGGIQVIADWILDQIREKGRLPGSRGVRREAAKFCRSNGYTVRNDEWLGI